MIGDWTNLGVVRREVLDLRTQLTDEKARSKRLAETNRQLRNLVHLLANQTMETIQKVREISGDTMPELIDESVEAACE